VTLARERSRTGLATVGYPILAHAAPKAAGALWTSQQVGSNIGWTCRHSSQVAGAASCEFSARLRMSVRE
jgi:hypothetical protein